MFSLEMQQYRAALRRQIASDAQNLARPYLLDLVLPVTIPTLRDLARARFRAGWLSPDGRDHGDTVERARERSAA